MPSILTVAPSGRVKEQVLLLTLARSSTVSMVSGRVADELAVEKAVSNTGAIA